MRPTRLWRPQPGRDRVGHPHRPRAASSSRSSTSRAKVCSWPTDFTGRSGSTGRSSMPMREQVEVAAVGLAQGVHEDRLGHGGQIADRGHAEAPEPLERRRPDAPQRLDRQRMQEGQLLPRRHHDDARRRAARRPASTVGLAASDASLARSFVGATPTEHDRPSSSPTRAGGWRRRSSAPSPNSRVAPADVEERLVEGDALHERRERLEDGVDVPAGRLVGGVVAGQEDGRAGTAAGPAPTAWPSGRRSAGPRTTPRPPRPVGPVPPTTTGSPASSGRRRTSTAT